MKKHLPPALVALLLVGTIGILWSRIHTLEGQVQTLTGQLHSEGATFQVGNTYPTPQNPPQPARSPFKLLNSARQNDHTDRATSVGVPWEIERAMIGEGRQQDLKREKAQTNEFDQRIDAPPVASPPEHQPLDHLLQFDQKAD